MRPSRRHLAYLSFCMLAIGLWLPTTAQASVKTGIKVRWLGERPKPAETGREFVGRLEVIAGKPGRLEGFEVVGQGWTHRGTDAPRSLVMGKGDRRIVTFRSTPQDPAAPLTIRGFFDGKPVEKTLRLDAPSLQKKRRLQFKDPKGPKLSGMRPRLAPGATERVTDQAISFSGRFEYQRTDGVWIGADNIVVKLWDDDSPDPFDEVIWSGTTDQNGDFEGSVIWDDCDIGCDDPDVYLEILPSNHVTELEQDDLFETAWSWETEIMDDFTGNQIDFGVMHPGSDTDGHAAVHIFNSMMRAHRVASTEHGMAPEVFDVLWPDENDGTHYDHFWEEIHISRERGWNELSHTHEFAHHLHHEYGNLLGNDYENGFCDDPDPSHCVWCPENVGDAWQEGFANWYGQWVTERYPVAYGVTPWAAGTTNGFWNEGRYGRDWLGKCEQDSMVYAGALTEGYVMALLRDMSDPVSLIADDHDGDATLDCDTDAMDIDADEIMTIFRDHDPTDITMFLDKFRLQYPQHVQDLWSAVRNVHTPFSFNLPDPIVLTQPPQCGIARVGETYTIQAVANGNLLQYQWRRNGLILSNGGGISGAQSSTLTLSPLTKLMTGSYDCLVKTCDGSREIVSNPSRLTVFDALATSRPYLTWGENYGAQCGNGTNVDWLAPGSYTGLTNVIHMDGGRMYSVALRSDGSVYTWGRTDNGELGNGFGWSNYVHSPQPINISNVIQIAAGNYHVLALLRDGTVKAWGYGWYGQLGDHAGSGRLIPWPSQFPGCVISVAAGYYHSLVLLSDGTVLACGNNDFGQLGNGTTGPFNLVPTQVSGLANIVAIAAAGYASYALRSDGTVWSWGDNAFGQLGIGVAQNPVLVPTQLPGLPAIKYITAAYYNGYAIANSGGAYAWGRGDMGTIGDGTANYRWSPTLIPGLDNPREIVSGDAGWTMALMQDNTLRAWGYNASNVLATGAINGSYRYSPEPVPGVVAVNHISAGYVTAHVLGHLASVTSVEAEPAEAAPLKLALRVAPVPSRSSTSLAFDLPKSGRVSIAIYDVAGRLVRTIVSEDRPAGWHTARWDGRSGGGSDAPAGVYFARLERAGEVLTRRIVLVR